MKRDSNTRIEILADETSRATGLNIKVLRHRHQSARFFLVVSKGELKHTFGPSARPVVQECLFMLYDMVRLGFLRPIDKDGGEDAKVQSDGNF